ncbi:MAG: Gp138 family membrane-puncturing spike protein [Flavobacterium sp.]
MTKTSTLPQSQLVPISAPNIDDNFSALKQEIFAMLNCHRVGTIESFDPATQTATIQLVDAWTQNTYNGSFSQPIAPLIKCPIVILKGSKGGFTSPINAGDQCLVIFNDRDLENWQKAGGEFQIPATARMHSITDAFAIVGVRSLSNPIADFNNEASELDYIDADQVRRGVLSLSEDVAEFKYIDVVGIDQAQVNLDSKVEIKNATKNLKTLIDQFIAIIINLKTTPDGGVTLFPIDSTTTTSLNTLLTEVDALLK